MSVLACIFNVSKTTACKHFHIKQPFSDDFANIANILLTKLTPKSLLGQVFDMCQKSKLLDIFVVIFTFFNSIVSIFQTRRKCTKRQKRAAPAISDRQPPAMYFFLYLLHRAGQRLQKLQHFRIGCHLLKKLCDIAVRILRLRRRSAVEGLLKFLGILFPVLIDNM